MRLKNVCAKQLATDADEMLFRPFTLESNSNPIGDCVNHRICAVLSACDQSISQKCLYLALISDGTQSCVPLLAAKRALFLWKRCVNAREVEWLSHS